MTEHELIDLFRSDVWLMQLVTAMRNVEIPDAWLVAGVLRAKVWDTLHGYAERTPSPDVDVAYFDVSDTNEAAEKQFDSQLQHMVPSIKWSCKNQRRMGELKGRQYHSALDGVAEYPETATAIGVRLDPVGGLEVLAPHGIRDLTRLILRPNPYEASIGATVFRRRVAQKNWLAQWPKLQVLGEDQW